MGGEVGVGRVQLDAEPVPSELGGSERGAARSHERVEHHAGLPGGVADAVLYEVANAASEGASAIECGRYLPTDLVLAATKAAGEVGLPTVITWGADPRPPIGDVSLGIFAQPFGMDSWSGLPSVIAELATHGGQLTLDAWLSAALQNDVVVVPLVSLLVRRYMLAHVVSDPGWQHCIGFLPYAPFLARMRGPVGLSVGRKRLAERTWVSSGSAVDKASFEAAIETIGRSLRQFVDEGGKIGLGSGYPEFGVFPRTGLITEAGYLEQMGIDTADILTAAVSTPARIFHKVPGPRIEPGSRVPFLVSKGRSASGLPQGALTLVGAPSPPS